MIDYKVYGFNTYSGLSTDIKPTVDVPPYAIFIETDTHIKYEYLWAGASYEWVYGANDTVRSTETIELYADSVGGSDINDGTIGNEVQTLSRLFDLISNTAYLDCAVTLSISGSFVVDNSVYSKLVNVLLLGNTTFDIIGTTTSTPITATYTNGSSFCITSSITDAGNSKNKFLISGDHYYPVYDGQTTNCYIPVDDGDSVRAITAYETIDTQITFSGLADTSLLIKSLQTQSTENITIKNTIIIDDIIKLSNSNTINYEKVIFRGDKAILDSLQPCVFNGILFDISTITEPAITQYNSTTGYKYTNVAILSATTIGLDCYGSIDKMNGVAISGSIVGINNTDSNIKVNGGYITIKDATYAYRLNNTCSHLIDNNGFIVDNVDYFIDILNDRNLIVSKVFLFGVPNISTISPTSVAKRLIDVVDNIYIVIDGEYQEFGYIEETTIFGNTSQTFDIGDVTKNSIVTLDKMELRKGVDTAIIHIDLIVNSNNTVNDYSNVVGSVPELFGMSYSFNVIGDIIKMNVASTNITNGTFETTIKRNVK